MLTMVLIDWLDYWLHCAFLCFPHFFFTLNMNYVYHARHKTITKVLLCTIARVAGAMEKKTIVWMFLK